MGGFECSSQRMPSGQRINMLAATKHQQLVLQDYLAVQSSGIQTVRDGICWHLIEQQPGRYGFSSALPMVRAARETGMQVIWDLCHYGWPDDLDIFSAAFVERCADFARAFARLLARESDGIAFIAPMNETSFLSWVAGEVGHFHPFAIGQGHALKRQLVRAAIAAIDALWSVLPNARIVHTDPLIHVMPKSRHPHVLDQSDAARQAQFDAWDMICGMREPELGGHPRYLDIIGLNYYPHNQWFFDGQHQHHILYTDPHYRPLHQLLHEVHQRYQRPLFVAETSSLGVAEPNWLRYVCEETRAALEIGLPIEGLCLYPIVDAPDWNDHRSIHQGLWSMPDERQQRTLCEPLARELQHQYSLFQSLPHVDIALPGELVSWPDRER